MTTDSDGCSDGRSDGVIFGVDGGDAQLAEAISRHPGMPMRFTADVSSDLARALGISGEPRRVRAPVTLDVLRIDAGRAVNMAVVNMVVVGPPPDRLRRCHRPAHCHVEVDGRMVHDGPATTVVVANGEYLRGLDVVPRGHPGDGRLEVHVYAVPAGQRRPMRARLATGTHLPHPAISTSQGKHAIVHWDGPVRLEVDGIGQGRVRDLEVTLSAGEATLVP